MVVCEELVTGFVVVIVRVGLLVFFPLYLLCKRDGEIKKQMQSGTAAFLCGAKAESQLV